ncbi:MAG: radical SAM protein [Bacteroidetes bacterium]|nr:MAG: radical SAM protein [Bacteroidota bacterium]
MRHFNIPVFIPELACPFRCVYCNQYTITGSCKTPDVAEVENIIQKHLSTIDPAGSRVEVAFFGGSFTGLEGSLQNQYLEIVQPWLKMKVIDGIRISTRPDYISENILENLRKMGVRAIELGAQSLNQEVLDKSGRGHTIADVENAARMIKSMGFELGLQMMTGLPGDNEEKSLQTARKIVELKADTTRIYPTLVIRDTPLAELYIKGAYMPQTLEDASQLCARLYDVFAPAGVKILRMGLHPSDGFFNGETLLAGPFHPAFGELVLSKVWLKKISHLPETYSDEKIVIEVNPAEINSAIGHKAQNRLFLQKYYKKVKFRANPDIPRGEYYVDTH